MALMSRYCRTWADGFGNWHAEVAGSGRNAYARARRAIHAELRERYETPTRLVAAPRLVLVSVSGCTYGCGDENCRLTSSHYRERVS